MRFQGVWITGILLLAGCATQHSTTDEVHEVAWYQGEVDEAFAAAKQEGKPLFLYWGAEWCPPCHQLKATIFHTPEFTAKIEAFVPLYLDGDTESAQILAERFGAEGYPTVIIFSPEGEEIMRMPSDISIDRYVALLDQALTRMRPVGEVLTAVMKSGPARANPGELNLLAFYSWGQDHKIDLDHEQRLETFKRLYEETPGELRVERSRFLTMWIEEETSREDGEKPLVEAELELFREQVAALLADDELRTANLSFVSYGSRSVIGLLYPEPSAKRDAMIAAWENAARAIEADETLSVDERLSAISTRVRLARLRAAGADGEDADDEIDLSPEFVDHVRERVAWAAETVSDESEMQSVMNTMAGILEGVGLTGEAQELLEARMQDTTAPYYFMSWMGGLKQDAEQNAEAVEWYRKAYDNARGRYTRFRWGSIYLRKVMDLEPARVQVIEKDSFDILGELLTHDDAFSGGNYSRLGQLATAYEAWNEGGEHDELVDRIRDFVQAECGRYPDGDDSQRSRCSEFLAG